VCAGGIIGLGEGDQDRVGLLLQLATLPEHPESVPINRLVAVKGTPLQVRMLNEYIFAADLMTAGPCNVLSSGTNQTR
jgi:biotin synthase-like enzyme